MDNQDWVALGDRTPPFPPSPPLAPRTKSSVDNAWGATLPTYVKPLDYELVSPPLPADLSKAEEPHSHYLKRFQVYHERKGKYVPFDPADSIPALSLEEKDEKYYFYVDVRYTVKQRRYPGKDFVQSTAEEPCSVFTNFSSPLMEFCRYFIGGNFYNGTAATTECDATIFFPRLPEMQYILSSSRTFLSKMNNKEATGEEILAFAKKLGVIAGAPTAFDPAGYPIQVPAMSASSTPSSFPSGSTVEQSLKTSVEHLGALVECIEEHFKPTAERLDMLLKNGHIEYNLLQYFFKPGQILTYKDGIYLNELSAVRVTSRAEQTVYQNNGQPAQAFSVSGNTRRWNGSNYEYVPFSQTIKPFSGTKSISDLPLLHLTPENAKALRERGKKYIQYSGPPQHRLYYADRVIIDEVGYSESGQYHHPAAVPDYDDDSIPGLPGSGSNTDKTDDDLELFLPPEVHGFNLTTKQWLSFELKRLEPMAFDDKAWDHLVLDSDTKALIKGLVDVTTSSNFNGPDSKVITDVISGKGGGLIALLHGPPGTGKTLTAEAVAEHLQRPLYMVGSSELSTNAPELESTLRRILRLATSWDAVLLIDEADIFLEQRSLHEIQRNSLVSVALRVFEYHQGVLFLTTNRIQTFDTAFLSRFSIAIKYPELNATSRFSVWSKFLDMAGCTIVDSMNASQLSQYKAPILRDSIQEIANEHSLNGRTIKNVVKTAQALALSSSKPLTLEHVLVVLRVQAKFLDDFKEQVAA